MTPKERFILAATNQEVDRPPVWMMRQAGRYLPEYRAIKTKHPTKEMMQTPEIACEITLQPVDLIGVDAAILYSDILMIPDAMGMGLEFAQGEGPTFQFNIQNSDDVYKLNTTNVNSRLSYVFETIKLLMQKLPSDYPLLGFAGAPFTVACYMIAGRGSKTFHEAKTLAWQQPDAFHSLLQILTEATIDYLLEQAHAGVVAVQLFDTWAGLLSREDYEKLAQPYTTQVFDALRQNNIPCIHYIKGGGYLLDKMSEIPSSVIGVDWRVDLKTVREKTKNRFAIQGNFDPDLLFSSQEMIEERLQQMLSDIPNPKKGYIINLGHGIHQHTAVENAKFFVKRAKELGKIRF